MRDRDEVVARFEEMRARKLFERKTEFLERGFKNCIHNVRLRIKGNGKVGICRNPQVVAKFGQSIICDEEGTALRCKHFDCRNTEESVEADFEDILKSPSRCGEAYPKLAMLIWFLQEYRRPNRKDRLKEAVVEVLNSVWSLVSGRWL
jgi:hypothetical protein